ncbi:hypothetical protein [Fulvivirga sedimenti]|uniref:Uncharacterized protein n=1 Tax=Fulvivirga sedimenti TaxID=2879465 RepID=A0A9X1L2T4_9BACT|nr:hypothetical protein [Fulvivirga sedimenti]MCA6078526.1 hypothetical protein [Fulvivirga sedimenti]
MITIDDFQTLPFERQCDYVSIFGDYLAHRSDGGLKFYLYHMEGFYVEVTYSPPHKRVIGIFAFHEIMELTPYLDDIDVNISFLSN